MGNLRSMPAFDGGRRQRSWGRFHSGYSQFTVALRQNVDVGRRQEGVEKRPCGLSLVLAVLNITNMGPDHYLNARASSRVRLRIRYIGGSVENRAHRTTLLISIDLRYEVDKCEAERRRGYPKFPTLTRVRWNTYAEIGANEQAAFTTVLQPGWCRYTLWNNDAWLP